MSILTGHLHLPPRVPAAQPHAGPRRILATCPHPALSARLRSALLRETCHKDLYGAKRCSCHGLHALAHDASRDRSGWRRKSSTATCSRKFPTRMPTSSPAKHPFVLLTACSVLAQRHWHPYQRNGGTNILTKVPSNGSVPEGAVIERLMASYSRARRIRG